MATALETQTVAILKEAFRDILEREWSWELFDEAWRLRCRVSRVRLYMHPARRPAVRRHCE
jgi:hypothetical protein